MSPGMAWKRFSIWNLVTHWIGVLTKKVFINQLLCALSYSALRLQLIFSIKSGETRIIMPVDKKKEGRDGNHFCNLGCIMIFVFLKMLFYPICIVSCSKTLKKKFILTIILIVRIFLFAINNQIHLVSYFYTNISTPYSYML